MVTSTANGSLYFPGDGSFSYTSNSDFSGIDSFTYLAQDSNGNESKIATVYLEVDPAPVANACSYWTAEYHSLVIKAPGLLDNAGDPGGGPLFVNSYTQPSNGQVYVDPDGYFFYSPASGFWGTDSFTYTVSDGYNVSAPATVTITVYSQPEVGWHYYDVTEGYTLNISTDDGLLYGGEGGAWDAEGLPLTPTVYTPPADGTLQLNADGSFSYTPNPGFWGPDSFSYTVTDGYATSEPVEVDLYVYPIPVVNPDHYWTVQTQELGTQGQGESRCGRTRIECSVAGRTRQRCRA